MILDHIAYRVKDRIKTVVFFCELFGYEEVDTFPVEFDDGTTAQCIVLESKNGDPDLFISDGEPGSIVADWVEDTLNGLGGVHHMAYDVVSVENTMAEWLANEWATFTSDKPHVCEGLVQVFTHPHPLTGVIYELIERDGVGFCRDNVKALMESTKDV